MAVKNIIRPISGGNVAGLSFNSGASGGSPPASYNTMDTVVTGAVFDIDFTITDSYGGTGTAVDNLVPSPADGETQATYDFTASDMTFNGTAGDSDAYVTFASSSSNSLLLSANTDFTNGLHDNEDFTLVTAIESLDSTWAFGALGGTVGGSGGANVGLRFGATATERMQFIQISGGSSAVNQQSTTILSGADATGDLILAIAYDHTAGDIKYWLNSSTGETISVSLTADTASATSIFQLFGAAGALVMTSTQWRIRGASMWNKALSNAEMADVFTEYNSRHATTYG